jgi:hypothetical protein
VKVQVLEIQQKCQRTPFSIVSPSNFQYKKGEIIDAGIILESSYITLYCLDDQEKQAIFVETVEDISQLSQAPFFYQAQVEKAQRLLAISYQDLHQLAQSIDEPLDNLILIYNVGRCGSTLLHHVFNRLDNTLSFSEPEIISQIVGIRPENGRRDDELAQLLWSCIRLLCKPIPDSKITHWVLKIRPIGFGVSHLMKQAFSTAKTIFLYRNSNQVVTSFIRAFGIPNLETWKNYLNQKEFHIRLLPLLENYFKQEYNQATAINFYTVRWLYFLRRYLSIYQPAQAICALRYEELVKHPQEIVRSLFELCDLPTSEVPVACQAFEKDSQAGSYLSRDNARKYDLSDADIQTIQTAILQFLQQQPDIQSPDFIVPATLGINRNFEKIADSSKF